MSVWRWWKQNDLHPSKVTCESLLVALPLKNRFFIEGIVKHSLILIWDTHCIVCIVSCEHLLHMAAAAAVTHSWWMQRYGETGWSSGWRTWWCWLLLPPVQELQRGASEQKLLFGPAPTTIPSWSWVGCGNWIPSNLSNMELTSCDRLCEYPEWVFPLPLAGLLGGQYHNQVAQAHIFPSHLALCRF